MKKRTAATVNDGNIFKSFGYTLRRRCLNLKAIKDQNNTLAREIANGSSTCRITKQWTETNSASVNPGSVSTFECGKSTVVTTQSNRQCPHTIYSFRQPGATMHMAIVTRIAERSCTQLKYLEDESCHHLSSRIRYCARHSCDLLVFRHVITPNDLKKYPTGWRSTGMKRGPWLNAVFYAKWDAVQAALRMGYKWVLLTDLDVTVMNLSVSFHPYTRAAEAAGRSFAVIDRPHRLPNAGCALIRNDAAGRRLVDRIIADWRGTWFQEDNGAFAHEIFRAGVPEAEYARPTRYDLKGIAWARMAEFGMPFGNRGKHPSVLFLDDDAEHRGLPRPFCVRPANDDFEPAFAPGDWMLHTHNMAAVHKYGPHLRKANEGCGC